MPHTSSLGSDQKRENFLQYVVEEMLHLLNSPDPAKPGYIQRREQTEKQQQEEAARQHASAANSNLTPSSSSTSLSNSEPVAPAMDDSMQTARSSDASHSSPREGDTPAANMSRGQRKKQAAARKAQNGSEQANVVDTAGAQQDLVTPTGNSSQDQLSLTGNGQLAAQSYPRMLFGYGRQLFTTIVQGRAYDPLLLTREKLKMARELDDALRRIQKDCKTQNDSLNKGLTVVSTLVKGTESKSAEKLKELSASPKEFEETLRTMLAVLKYFSEPDVDGVLTIVAKYDSEIGSSQDAATLSKEFYSDVLRVAFDIWFDALRDTQKTVVAYQRELPKEPGDALIKQIFEMIRDADKIAVNLTPEEALRYTTKDIVFLSQKIEEQQAALKAATYLWATDNACLKGLSNKLDTWKERILEAQSNTNQNRSAHRPAA